jgi:CRP-like cAMP-binding protein
MSDDDVAALLALPYSITSFSPGGWLVRQGDAGGHCHLILSGFVCRQKLLRDGARQIVSVHMKGDLVGLDGAFFKQADDGVQALGAVEAAAVPAAALLDLAFARPAVGRALWAHTLADAAIHREWVANVGQRDARSRIAHLLCELALLQEAAELSDGRRYELPLTQEQIADATGLTGVHVNRVLRTFDIEGLVSRERKTITILDWPELSAAAGFSEDYLRFATERQGTA